MTLLQAILTLPEAAPSFFGCAVGRFRGVFGALSDPHDWRLRRERPHRGGGSAPSGKRLQRAG
eukprot:2421254-Alexandrium_andersonii.AAC.1